MTFPGPSRGDGFDPEDFAEHRPTAWALFVAVPLVLVGVGVALWLGYEVPLLRRDVVRGYLAPGVAAVLGGAVWMTLRFAGVLR